MKTLIQRFVREEDGQDIIEYALLAAFISIAAILAIKAIGPKVNTYFTNVSSDSNRSISLRGRSGSSGSINGVHFKNLTIQGKAVTSQTDSDASWNIANGVTNITFE